MEKINSEAGLRDAILQLESKQSFEEKVLRAELHIAYESMKPVNLIKNTFKEVIASRDLKADLVNTSVGLTAGYLSKKVFEGVSGSPIKKLLGTALMFGVTNAVAKHPDAVKSLAIGVLRFFTNIRENKTH